MASLPDRLSFGFLAIALLAGAPAAAQCVQGAQYKQSDAIKQWYPDPSVRFDTPAAAPSEVPIYRLLRPVALDTLPAL